MLADPVLKQVMEEFRQRNPEFCAAKKVRRRGMSMERNFKPDSWFFENTPERLFQLELDSICYRFNLFGFEDFCHTPLLQKLTVNATAHGVMIFIPRYWSLDPKRDLNWKEIKKLLKCWGMQRQEQKWSRAILLQKCRKAYLAWLEAKRAGKKGPDVYDYVIEQAELNKHIDAANVRKLVRKGEKLEKGKKSAKTKG